mgnify:CR=1 FL=1
MLSVVLRYYHTLKFLQWTQIKYRLRYQFSPIRPDTHIDDVQWSEGKTRFLNDSIDAPKSWLGNNVFKFLNQLHQFDQDIDWNFRGFGKLWTYNLNYFEFLAQANLSKYEGLGLIHDFINKEKEVKDGMEPFPISLRCIFWIRFLIKHQIKDEQIDQSLFGQLQLLSKRPEYHLMGNHLLENGFSLLFGACYFDNEGWWSQAKNILETQLTEQILSDGSHFELSPMYHQIMLYRLLDSINLLQNNYEEKEIAFLELLKNKAELMLGWLQQMTFSNGDLPQVNDSTNNIAPTHLSLMNYARQLNISIQQKQLSTSGYRKINRPNYEILIDVGQIGPDYIPGHAHSDTFNFVLHHQSNPLIVDTGISTYEKNKRRNVERSTSAHNTVMIDGLEQSEVWGGFRVARRAKVTLIEETNDIITAAHNGYQRINCEHQRSFNFHSDAISIKDTITKNKVAKAFFHFDSNVKIELIKDTIKGTFGEMNFEGCDAVKVEPYLLAKGFNHKVEAVRAVVTFHHQLLTKITFQ